MVTITGTGFAEVYQVVFSNNDYMSDASSYGDTTIIASVPPGAVTGPITLVSTNGTTMTATFTVTP